MSSHSSSAAQQATSLLSLPSQPPTAPAPASSPRGRVVTMPPPPTTPTTTAVHPSPREQEETAAESEVSIVAGADEEEDLLRDVLEELDRERSKRAELESKVRLLTEEHAKLSSSSSTSRLQEEVSATKNKHKGKQQLSSSAATSSSSNPQENPAGSNNSVVSRADYVALQAQVEGFKQLVDALTLNKPAIRQAYQTVSNNNNNNTTTARARSATNALAPKLHIPIHMVRLLEVMPWDPLAQDYIHAVEELYEWQIYDSASTSSTQAWQSHLRYFPILFKSLPVVQPQASAAGNHSDSNPTNLKTFTTASSNRDRSLLVFLAGGGDKGGTSLSGAGGGGGRGSRATSNTAATPSKHGTLTDERITKLYNMEAGFPLPSPEYGTWQWIGGWKVETNSATAAKRSTKHTSQNAPSSTSTTEPTTSSMVCDEHGWSYAREGQHFLLDTTGQSLIKNHAGFPHEVGTMTENSSHKMAAGAAAVPKYKIQRRRWTRRRMLVDYPFASERTQHYLALLAENARLSLTVDKVTDQLVETKSALTEAESALVRQQADVAEKVALLRAMGVDSEAVTALSATTPTRSVTTGAATEGGGQQHLLQDFLSKNEQVKEIGSKISQWVTSARKTSEDYLVPPDGSVVTGATITSSGSPDGQTPATLAPSVQRSLSADASVTAAAGGGFDWKKIGRGGLMDRIKQGQVMVMSPPKRVASAVGPSASGEADMS